MKVLNITDFTNKTINALSALFVSLAVCACAGNPENSAKDESATKPVKLVMGEEHVVVRGIRPEEQLWGAYQFPRPYNLGDRIVVAVHVKKDDVKNLGKTNKWFESRDKGKTWREIDDSVEAHCGLLMQNGDRIYFPLQPGTELKGYKLTPQDMLTPAYDFSKKAEEGTLPIPDGRRSDGGCVILAYNADRLPPSLSKKEWQALRIPAGKSEPVKENVKVDWPFLTRVVFTGAYYKNTLKAICPRGNPKIGPDGAVWICSFSGEGHINPENGQYSPYYSAEMFRSEDFGKTFKLHAHMEYEADGKKYPYLSGGFSDNDFEFMPDGSIVWFFRTAWYGSTGVEWAPMYMSRSVDMGKTWSKPEKFAHTGVFPMLCKLECGVTLICYARPGIFVQATENDSGTKWSKPLVVMTPDDRSGLANVVRNPPRFHDWDGACNNPEIVPLDRNSALLFYSDFYYPDENGVKRKTILCRKITVERQ